MILDRGSQKMECGWRWVLILYCEMMMLYAIDV